MLGIHVAIVTRVIRDVKACAEQMGCQVIVVAVLVVVEAAWPIAVLVPLPVWLQLPSVVRRPWPPQHLSRRRLMASAAPRWLPPP